MTKEQRRIFLCLIAAYCAAYLTRLNLSAALPEIIHRNAG